MRQLLVDRNRTGLYNDGCAAFAAFERDYCADGKTVSVHVE